MCKEAGGGGEGARDTESKTRTPHKVVGKNLVFYRVLWPSPSPGFISATLKNHGFFKVLGLRKGSGREN